MGKLQSALRLIYPHQCVTCDALVEQAHGLCGPCWSETPFVLGLACDACGAPLPGEADAPVRCDDCMAIARPWARGRTALLYSGAGRRLVLRLKHGDRLDIAPAAAVWMARAAAPLMDGNTVIVPVPSHWLRRIARRYNQAAVLALALARHTGRTVLPRALTRRTATKMQHGTTRNERFAALAGAIAPHPVHGAVLEGRHVLLVDDVMTSGATLAACTEACSKAGAARIDVVTLARTARDA